MIVVAVISVACAFIFVTKIYSRKEVYDIADVADVSTGDAIVANGSVNVPVKDSGTNPEKKKDAGQEKVAKTEKQKNNKGDTDNGKGNSGIMDKILVPMDSIVVNLGDVNSKRYLRVIISLEVGSSEIEQAIKEKKVIFRDKLVSFLSTKKVEDIGTQASQSGLRTEIKDILNNEILGSDNAITQVYFSDFIIQ